MKKKITTLFLLLGLAFAAHSQKTDYTMVKADYQTVVNAANSLGVNTSTYPDDSDNYFGTSSYYSNFDIVEDGSWNRDAFSTWEKAVQTALATYVLPSVFPNASLNSLFRVFFTYYDGLASGTDYFDFKCTKATPNPEFTFYPGENGSTKADIRSFTVAGQISSTTINPENATIELTMAPGTNVTALAPEITISTGAALNPASGSPVNFTNPVVYTVTAEDATVSKTWTVTVHVMEETVTPIRDIQFVADPATSDKSPLLGQNVIIQGIVTGFNTFGTYNKYYVQDEYGAWNGIYVYDRTTGVVLSVGDLVKVTGVIDEYYGVTELVTSAVEIISSRNATPNPVVVTAPITEELEGVLVTVQNVQITTDGDSIDSKKFLLATTGGVPFKVNNELFGAFEPESGKTYNLTGIVAYLYNYFRICPRSANDFATASDMNTLSNQVIARIFPNPATDKINLAGINAEKVIVKNIVGQTVLSAQVENNQINISHLHQGIYFLEGGSQVIRFVKK